MSAPADRGEAELAPFRRLAARVVPGGVLLRAWRLTGGVSAEITALEVARPDAPPLKLVVRRHGEIDRAANPTIARDEYRLLEIARAHGLAVPRPYLVAGAGDLFPTPLLVVEFVEGTTDFSPVDLAGYLAQAAAELARIHGVTDRAALAFLPRVPPDVEPPPARLDVALGEARIRAALARAGPRRAGNAPVLLHGDYWPGNLLWRDGRLAAVVDWEDAAVGDPLVDLANSRLEFLLAFDAEAMAAFTRHYLAARALALADLPYWELRAALRLCGKLGEWGLEAAAEERMRTRHAHFVAAALAALDGRPHPTV